MSQVPDGPEHAISPGPQGFAVGQPVRYHRTQRGGYGFVQVIPATVTAVGPKRVQVEYDVRQLRDGLFGWEPKRVWVDPKNVEEAPPMVDR